MPLPSCHVPVSAARPKMLRVIWLVLVLLVLLVLFVAVLLGHGAGKVLHHLVSGGAFRV